MTIAVVYDPRYHTWESWASLMVEAFSAQQLSVPGSEKEWKSWAEGLKAIDVFTNEAIPGPAPYQNWQDWAAALVNAINRTVNV